MLCLKKAEEEKQSSKKYKGDEDALSHFSGHSTKSAKCLFVEKRGRTERLLTD